MKKCSYSAHETLTELNITPLLDLAFVLLVIFIITTTPLVSESELNLPSSSKHPKDPPRKTHYISVDAGGKLWIDKKIVDMGGLQESLISMRMDDPDLSVIVRGDAKTKYRQIRALLDVCQQANVAKVDLATDPNEPH